MFGINVWSSQSKTKILYFMWYSKILLYMQLRNVDVCQANKLEEDIQRSAELIFNPAVNSIKARRVIWKMSFHHFKSLLGIFSSSQAKSWNYYFHPPSVPCNYVMFDPKKLKSFVRSYAYKINKLSVHLGGN